MSEIGPQLQRIEGLLRQGNELRAEAIALQREALASQQTLIAEQRAQLARAAQINDGALAVQQRARRLLVVVLPFLFLLVAYASYLLFFRVQS